MSRHTATILTLLLLSVGANFILGWKVARQQEAMDALARRPTGLVGDFVTTARFSARDSITGDPVEDLEFRGAFSSGGEAHGGASAAFDSSGRLLLFVHGSAPLDVLIGAPGYEDSNVEFSRLTPDRVEVAMKRKSLLK